jgi:hypothetical protein
MSDVTFTVITAGGRIGLEIGCLGASKTHWMDPIDAVDLGAKLQDCGELVGSEDYEEYVKEKGRRSA